MVSIFKSDIKNSFDRRWSCLIFEVYKKNNAMNTNKIFTILFSLSLLFVSTNSFAHNDDDPTKKEKVKVITSSIEKGYATIKWFDQEIDFIEIVSNNDQFMPSIPVLDAASLHLHDLMNGTYMINFKSKGKVLYTKEITVQR
jgi:hypothetical protein